MGRTVVVIVGSGLTGLETAEYFMDRGNRITIVEMRDKIGPGLYAPHYYDLYPKLAEQGTVFLTSSKLTEVCDGYVIVEDRNGARITPKADHVFFAAGVRSVNDLKPVAEKVCSKVIWREMRIRPEPFCRQHAQHSSVH